MLLLFLFILVIASFSIVAASDLSVGAATVALDGQMHVRISEKPERGLTRLEEVARRFGGAVLRHHTKKIDLLRRKVTRAAICQHREPPESGQVLLDEPVKAFNGLWPATDSAGDRK